MSFSSEKTKTTGQPCENFDDTFNCLSQCRNVTAKRTDKVAITISAS